MNYLLSVQGVFPNNVFWEAQFLKNAPYSSILGSYCGLPEADRDTWCSKAYHVLLSAYTSLSQIFDILQQHR